MESIKKKQIMRTELHQKRIYKMITITSIKGDRNEMKEKEVD